MSTISLCMVVKNQATSLSSCLESVGGLADEIIIVDISSDGNIKQTAEKFGAAVFPYIWNNHYADARNYSFSKATMDYILWLNAEETLPAVSVQKLLRLKNRFPQNTDVLYLRSEPAVNGSCYEPRLLKRTHHYVWLYPTDETLYVWGDIAYRNIAVLKNDTLCVEDLRTKTPDQHADARDENT